MAKKTDELTIFLKYVPILETVAGVDYLLGDTIEVSPDPAFLDEGEFKKVEWVVLNGGGQLDWSIKKKNFHKIADINYPHNSDVTPINIGKGSMNYSVFVTGTNVWGLAVSASKDPEIHWGRRGG